MTDIIVELISGLLSIVALGISVLSSKKAAKTSRELENYKAELNSRTAKMVRIDEKELGILATTWELIEKACGLTLSLVGFREYSSLDSLNDMQLEEFLAQSCLLESEKEEVRKSDKKSESYQEMRHLHDFNDARHAIRDAQVHIAFHRPFLTEDLLQHLDDLIKSLHSIDTGTAQMIKFPNTRSAFADKVGTERTDLPKKKKSIEILIRNHLYYGIDGSVDLQEPKDS